MTQRNRLHTNPLDASLSELESKLRNAYMQKHLEAQMAEKRAERMSRDLQERIAKDLMDTALISSREQSQEAEAKRCEEARKLQRHLEKQMAEKKLQREYEECQEKLDRMALIEADRVTDESERLKKAWKKISEADWAMRQYLLQKEMQLVMKKRLEDVEDEEELRILKYEVEVEARKRVQAEARKERMAQREAAIEYLAKALIDQTSDLGERRELLTEIIAEEMQREGVARVLEEEDRRRNMREKWTESLRRQVEMKEDFRRKVLEEEERFVEESLKRAMADEWVRKQTDLAKKRRRVEYREELKKVMDERRRKREEEVELFWELMEQERLKEMKRWEEIGEERRKLLEKHSKNVGGFIDVAGLTREEQEIVTERGSTL